MVKSVPRKRKRVRKPWSKDDIKIFKKMAKQGAPALAKHFKRTVPTIRAKAHHLAISLRVAR